MRGHACKQTDNSFSNAFLMDASAATPNVPNSGYAPLRLTTGSATATDLPGDDLTQNYRAMEEIQFQQMRDRGMNVQRTAMELFKAGRKSQAVQHEVQRFEIFESVFELNRFDKCLRPRPRDYRS